ncbi:MAG: anti-sigma factor [Candidatus Limnocylindrales bacterium]
MSGHDAMDPREVRVGGLTCAEAQELAVLCVLDVLTPDEAAPVHAHLAGCERPHPDIDRAAEAAGVLALSAEPVRPPAELRGRLMDAVVSTPQVPDRLPVVDAVTPAPIVVPFERPAPAARPSRWVWIGLAAAAVIALLLGGWNLTLQRQVSDADQQLALVRQAVAAASDPTSTVAQLAGTDAAPGASGMVVIPATGTGYVMVQGLPALPDDQVYQAWYLAGGTPTSAGLMDPSGSGVTVMAGLEPIPGTDTIALTVEPAGGVPQPTGAIVLAGTLSA